MTSPKTAAFGDLNAADGLAVVLDHECAEIGHGLELGDEFPRRIVSFVATEIQGLDEDGVLTFPVLVTRPEIKLVVGSFGVQIINDGLVADSGPGFGQIEGDFASNT